jgi:hypothetical protein
LSHGSRQAANNDMSEKESKSLADSQSSVAVNEASSVRPRLRFLRFTLRGLLLFVLLFSLWIGWHVNRAHKQRRALAKIEELDGTVAFDYQYAPTDSHNLWAWVDRRIENPAPLWLREKFGEDYFRTVISVGLNRQLAFDPDISFLIHLPDLRYLSLRGELVSDDFLKLLADKLPQLVELNFGQSTITDEGLKQIGRLRDLEVLHIDADGVTDSGLQHVAGLTRLRRLGLNSSQIGDAGMNYLASLSRLKSLRVMRTQITDVGFARLANMSELELLSLYGAQISDAGLANLANMPKMKQLLLSGSNITDKGLEQLAHLTQAKEITFLHAQVTNEGCKWLSKQLGGARVFVVP